MEGALQQGLLSHQWGWRSIKKRAQERHSEQQHRMHAEKKRVANAADPSVGAFEQFTKGIGAKLLASMG